MVMTDSDGGRIGDEMDAVKSVRRWNDELDSLFEMIVGLN